MLSENHNALEEKVRQWCPADKWDALDSLVKLEPDIFQHNALLLDFFDSLLNHSAQNEAFLLISSILSLKLKKIPDVFLLWEEQALFLQAALTPKEAVVESESFSKETLTLFKDILDGIGETIQRRILMQLVIKLNTILSEKCQALSFSQRILACLEELDNLTMLQDIPNKNDRGFNAFNELALLIAKLEELSAQQKSGLRFHKEQEVSEMERKPLKITLSLFAEYLAQRGHTNGSISCQII
ncbi:MAG: hypothetical protein WC785_07210 [Tatlockia sp.]|jgi:hypothetical protein